MFTAMIGALVLSAAGTPAQVDFSTRVEPPKTPSLMTGTEIAEFNRQLVSANHPDFIKCRKLDVSGSLVKKSRVCRTNEQWRVASDIGNQNARDTQEAMTRAPVNSSN